VKETTNANLIKGTTYAKMRGTVDQQTTTMGNGTSIDGIQMKHLSSVIKKNNLIYENINTLMHLS
jgi:hypothetical protein